MRMTATRAPGAIVSSVLAITCGLLVFYASFVDQHHWDVIAYRVYSPALDALEPIFIFFGYNLRLTNRAHEDFQQFFADWHGISY